MSLPKADVLALLAVAFATLSGLALTLTRPYLAPDSEPLFTFDHAAQEELFQLITNEFGLFTAPRMSDDWLPDGAGDLARGRTLYQVQCLHCHGSDGGAETLTARMLKPSPRNFSLGEVRLSSTIPPLRDDLRRVVLEGIPATSMSSFAGLPADQRDATVDYVMYLLIRGAVWNQALELLESSTPANAFGSARQTQKARWSHPQSK